MYNSNYVEITGALTSGFKTLNSKKNIINKYFKQKKDIINKNLNKIAVIDEKRYIIIQNNTPVYNDEYYKFLKNQNKQISILIKEIDEDPVNMLNSFFKYEQDLFFQISVNNEYKTNFHREMKIKYLFEESVIKNKNYNTYIYNFFKQLTADYKKMKYSMLGLQDNVFTNQTNVDDVNDKDSIFEEKLKHIKKLKQHLLLIFIFYRCGVIDKKDINNFLTVYINAFKQNLEISTQNNLEIENIRVWATGVRFIEVIAASFKYTNKYIKEYIKYADIVNKLCPHLRFM